MVIKSYNLLFEEFVMNRIIDLYVLQDLELGHLHHLIHLFKKKNQS